MKKVLSKYATFNEPFHGSPMSSIFAIQTWYIRKSTLEKDIFVTLKKLSEMHLKMFCNYNNVVENAANVPSRKTSDRITK